MFKYIVSALAVLCSAQAFGIGASQAWVKSQITKALGQSAVLDSNDATNVATKGWVIDNFVRRAAESQPKVVSLSTTGAATLDDGTNVEMTISFYTPTNVVLWCCASDTNAVAAGTLWTWDDVNKAYVSTNTSVTVKSRDVYSLSVSTNSMTGAVSTNSAKNVELYTSVGGAEWLTTEIGGRVKFRPTDGSPDGFTVQFTTVTEAQYAALKTSLVADTRSPLMSVLFRELLAVDLFDLVDGPTQGSLHQSIYIGSITYTKGANTFTFLGGGYTNTGLDMDGVDMESWAQGEAHDIYEIVSAANVSTYDYTALIDDAWRAKESDIQNACMDASSWGLKFPLVDDQGTTIAKSRFEASSVWLEACTDVMVEIKTEFYRLVNADLNAYSTYVAPHDCPTPPEGGWTCPGGCRCAAVSKATIQFNNGTAKKDAGGACPNAAVAQHVWGYYVWQGGRLVRSSAGCKLCTRCLTPYEDEGAVHAMVPDTDSYDYCGCYCRYYYTAKYEMDKTEAVTESGVSTDVTTKTEIVPITENEAEDTPAVDVIVATDENGEAAYFKVQTTAKTNETERAISKDDPRRKAYTFTVTRGEETKTVLISAGAATNFKKHTHVVAQDDCWCYCGLYHEFKKCICETVCDKCRLKLGTPSTKDESYTVGSGDDVHEITVTVDNLVESTEEDHTPIMAADWTVYDGEGNVAGTNDIPQECGCACGEYRGWYAHAGTPLTGKYAFHRSDFCNYWPQVEKQTQTGAAIANTDLKKKYNRCKCWCLKDGNTVEIGKVGRLHEMRPGELCPVVCMDCGESFSRTQTGTIAGFSADGTTEVAVYKYDTSPMGADDAKLQHRPITIGDIRGWVADYPQCFAGMTEDAILEFLGCGCKCRKYTGEDYPVTCEELSDDAEISDAEKKVKKQYLEYHIRGVYADKCGCLCLPSRHLSFVKTPDGCPKVCGSCGEYGVGNVKITDDNFFNYHSLPCKEVTDESGTVPDKNLICGCACMVSTNEVKLAVKKQCVDYGFGVFNNDLMTISALKAFHYYDGIGTDAKKACACQGGEGPHEMTTNDSICVNVCDGCNAKVVDDSTKNYQYYGRSEVMSDHTFDDGRCKCQCVKYVKTPAYAVSSSVRYPDGDWTCSTCGLVSPCYKVTFRCSVCNATDHDDVTGYKCNSKCEHYDDEAHTCPIHGIALAGDGVVNSYCPICQKQYGDLFPFGYIEINGEKVALSSDKTSFDAGEYGGNTGVTKVNAPNVTVVGVGSFQGCPSLTMVSLPAARTIGDCAFYMCAALTSLDLSSMTVAMVTEGAQSWDVPSGCVVTCSDGMYTFP